jgi:hypothetical protein
VQTPDDCPPICGAVGHRHVNIMVWRCDHNGRIQGWIDAYETHTGEPVLTHRSIIETGPFTLDVEWPAIEQRLLSALGELLQDPSTL